MAVLHMNSFAKAESSVKVTSSDAKKVYNILMDKKSSTVDSKKNLNFLKSISKTLTKF